jgi:hypothetical protein
MPQGQINTYSFGTTTTLKRTVANVIRNIDPQDVPCVSYFGLNNQGKFNLQNFPNPKYEWLMDTLRARTTTVNNSGVLAIGDTDVVVADSTLFKVGDVIEIEDEKIYISNVVTSTHTLTIERGWGSTSAAQHADSSTVTYLFSAREEGAESNRTYYTTPSVDYNYSQILHAEILVSGSEQDAVSRYGISDQYKYQLMKLLGGAGSGAGKKGRAGELMIDLEKTFFYGERVERADGTAGAMGGPKIYITTNTKAAGGDYLSQDMLEDEIQACWAVGGSPNVIIAGAFNKRLISSWYAGSVRTERTERTGGVRIERLETEFGDLDLMLNRWCPADEVYILQSDLMGWVTLRDWFVEPLAKGGDYKKDQIVGEFGFVLTNEKANALISGTATS